MSTAGPDDAGSHDSTGDPVRDWLDAFAQRQLPFETVRERIIELCARDAEASWSALSRLDQYHRRGIIDRDAFSDLKRRIVHVAMPGHSRASASRPAMISPAAEAQPQSVTTTGTAATAVRRVAPGVVLLGRYEIEAEVGRGARTTVFRARDRERSSIDGVSDLVAIKTLRDDVDDRADALETLRRECFRTQILTHANIIKVFDLERDGDTLFVTMEFVAGESLQRVLADLAPRRLRRDHALAIIGAIGDALACAHASGIVHGDLEPGKVMIGPDGRVCVQGFGGVRPDPREPSFQVDGLRTTTSHYASPQVLRGAHAVPGDDVFSLGCIACDLLTGVAPLPDSADARTVRRRAKRRKPRGMHRRDWPLVRRALAAERDARPESVARWVAELTREGERPMPSLDELVDRARAPRRFRLVHGLIAATVLVAILGIAPPESRARLAAYVASIVAAPGAGPEPKTAPEPAAGAPKAAVPDTTGATRAAEPAPAPAPSEPIAAVEGTQRPAPRVVTPPSHDTGLPAARGTSADAPAGADRPFIAMTADSVTAGEGDGAVQVTVQRFGSRARALEFTWWTEGGSARPGTDYAKVEARNAGFLPGEGRVRLVVPLVDDSIPEGPESFSLRVRVDRAGADPGFVASTITIIDDDTPTAGATPPTSAPAPAPASD